MSTFRKPDGSLKKSIYHSDLCYLTANNPVTVIFTSGPVNSKYANRPQIVKLTVPPDQTVYSLDIEHEGIKAVLASIPLNTPVQIRAFGERAGATLQVVGYGNGAAAPSAQQSLPQQAPAPAPQQPNGGVPEQQPLTRSYFHAFMAAHEVVSKILEDTGSTFVGLSADTRFMATKDIATSFNIAMEHNPNRMLRGR